MTALSDFPIFWLEIAKLALQFLGALAVARVAVTWALARYKSEKMWERRLAAYIDAISALSEMRLVLGHWFDEAITDREPTPEEAANQQARFMSAKRRVEDGIATARLLLPAKTASQLATFEREFERAKRGETWEEDLDNQIGVVSATLNLLIEQGRVSLGERHLQ